MTASVVEPEVSWVLWSGTIGLESPMPERFPAATAGGYDCLSLSALDVARSTEHGLAATEIRRRAEDSGLRLILDPVMNWHPESRVSVCEARACGGRP